MMTLCRRNEAQMLENRVVGQGWIGGMEEKQENLERAEVLQSSGVMGNGVQGGRG